jgi:hypothetical protein
VTAFPRRALGPVVLSLAASLGLMLTACNVFDPLDSPTGDAQLLSAARAAFDEGQLDRALEYYGKLSADQAETRAAEEAFVLLDQNDAGIGALMTAIGDKPELGAVITRLANSMAAAGATTAKRDNLFAALRKVNDIPSNAQLRGLVRFASGLALVAQTLAFDAGRTGDSAVLDRTDLADTPDTCQSNPALNCNPPSAGNTIVTGTYGNDLKATTVAATPAPDATLGFVIAAFDGTLFALQRELDAKGDYSSMTDAIDTLVDNGGGGTTNVVRGFMLKQGIGQ